MFKKSLVALALITASGGAFAAADITGTAETEISIEGSASLDAVTAADIDVELGAEYTVGDILTFTFSGGDVDTDTAPANYVTNAANAGSVTIGLLNTAENVLTYRVTEIVAGATTIGETILLADIEFDRDAVVADGGVTVTYAAKTAADDAIDSGDNSEADLFSTTAQFVTEVTTAFDATIDVEESRLQFDDNDVVDTLVIDIDTDAALTFAVAAADVLVDVVVTGDFSYLDTDPGTDGIQLHANASVELTGSVSADGSAALTATTATWEDIDVTAADTLTITVDATGAVANKSTNVIPEQTFSVDLDINYDDFGDVEGGGGTQGSDTESVNDDAGEWDLNGSVVEIPFMPFGPVTQPIIYHTNNGAQTGDVTMRYMVQGDHTSYQSTGILVSQAEPGVRNLLSEVTAALLAEGYDATTTGFKVALELTTNVPANDVKVTAAAKFTTSDSDRLSIGVMSSN